MTSRLAMALAAGLIVAAGNASARTRHHHHAGLAPAAAAYTPGGSHESYYPTDVKGGSPGNLPFNNQIRKLSDPLNANGAK